MKLVLLNLLKVESLGDALPRKGETHTRKSSRVTLTSINSAPTQPSPSLEVNTDAAEANTSEPRTLDLALKHSEVTHVMTKTARPHRRTGRTPAHPGIEALGVRLPQTRQEIQAKKAAEEMALELAQIAEQKKRDAQDERLQTLMHDNMSLNKSRKDDELDYPPEPNVVDEDVDMEQGIALPAPDMEATKAVDGQSSASEDDNPVVSPDAQKVSASSSLRHASLRFWSGCRGGEGRKEKACKRAQGEEYKYSSCVRVRGRCTFPGRAHGA
jgi:hypothetical protein